MSDLRKQSSTAHPLLFLLTLSSDHISPATGLSPTVTLSKDGAAFASPSGAVSEIGSGWYKVAGNATDTNTLGPLVLHATAGTADPVDILFRVVAFDPDSATNLGLSGLPTANPAASGGLLTVGTGTGQLNPNGSGNLTGLTQANSGTAQAGSSTTLTLAVGASSITDLYKGNYIAITSGTGAGQSRSISAYNGTTLVATTARAWTVTPDATSVYAIWMNPHPSLDSNLAVTLTSTEHTNIATDVGTGLTAQGYTTTRAPYLDNLNGITAVLTNIQALLGVNQGVRNFGYDGSGNLQTFDLCLYNNSSNATTNDGSTGLVHKYTITSTYNGSNQQTAQSTIQIS